MESSLRLRLSPYHKIFHNEWKLKPNSTQYNIVFDQTLSNTLNIEKLNEALRRFVSDYLIINSHILEKNQELYWIKNDIINSIELFTENITQKKLWTYVSAPFDLEKGPLYRFALFHNKDNTYRFIVVFHHIIVDGNWFDTIIKEISQYYNDSQYNNPLSIIEQTKKIKITVDDLYHKLERSAADNHYFWENQLSNIEAVDLRFVKSNNVITLTNDINPIKEIDFSFDKNTTQLLEQIQQTYNISAYLYGQIIFALLLHKYTLQKEFAISYPIAIKEASGLIQGNAINTNIFPCRIDTNHSLQDLIVQAKDFISYVKDKHQYYSYYPIDAIVSNIQKDLLNLFFAQTNLKTTPFDFLGTETLKIHDEFNIDLSGSLLFEQEVDSKGLNYRIRYNELEVDGVLLESFITRYKLLFCTILEDLIQNRSNKLITEYNILSDKEYQKLIYAWNNTSSHYPERKTIHEIFEEQVSLTPNNIAIVCEERQLSYKLLNAKANCLAHYLMDSISPAKTLEPDDLVAICLNKNESLIITMLAILKTGAAYIPINPAYPENRIKHIIEESRPKIIIINANDKEKYTAVTNVQVIVIEEFESGSKSLKDILNVSTKTTSHHLAHVIYTSGTSGQPKGVMIEHHNVVSLVKNVEYITITSTDRILQLADTSFDAATFEIWGALLNGASLYIIPNTLELFSNSHTFESYLNSQHISILWLTKSLFDETYLANPSTFSQLKYLLVGGEALNYELVKKLITSSCKPQHFINGYGPTENTTFSCTAEINPEILSHIKSIPIGRPLTNRCAYVLDNNLAPLPIGAIGTLYVGGEGLSRGYLNHTDLNNQFKPNPFQTEEEKEQNKNAQIYNTGDLVRWTSEGILEYIGRNDSQIKIRSYRVELHEIENKLLAYPGIKQAFVTPKDHNYNNTHNKYLVAYYVANEKIDDFILWPYLTAHLPFYMIPNVFIHLNKFPLTLNGKLDPNKLPEPGFDNQKSYEAPNRQLQQTIINIWADILGISQEKIGIRNSFFSLGGNSLLIIKLKIQLSKIDELKDITIADLFQFHTIEQLTHFVDNNKDTVIPVTSSNTIKNVKTEDFDIAIIGVSGAFSGSENEDQYWKSIRLGIEGIEQFSIDRCKEMGVSEEIWSNENFVPVSGHLVDIDKFDHNFWSLSPNEAKLLDPQIRKLLEHCWYVLESSGYLQERRDLNIGVFTGSGNSDYLKNTIPTPQSVGTRGLPYLISKDSAATKVSYFLGLTGASSNINTACSTSLVTIVEACKQLSSGYCDMALAGGVALLLPNEIGHIYYDGLIFSKDKHCRIFDDESSGIINGSGIGIILLKRLVDAKKDNDNILAVIKGYAINNDGDRKMTYTAPSVTGQKECIISAQKMAKISSNVISYVECHGTGTCLGDPIEVQALSEAFKYNEDPSIPSIPCMLGSVKANIGHADSAAGIAGLIKVCKMIEHKTIPKQINYNKLNSEICLDNTPFDIPLQSIPWQPPHNMPRIAGVSSFGIGGTNAHVIISEYIPEELSLPATSALNSFYTLPLSAKSEISLQNYKKEFIKYLATTTDHIRDIAYTLQLKRKLFKYAIIIKAHSILDAINQLQSNIKIVHSPQEYNSDFDLSYPWEKICKKIKLPSYQFEKNSHWVNENIPRGKKFKSPSPLLQSNITLLSVSKRVIEKPLPRHYYEIAQVFLDILEVNNISIYDDFFQLGGNSLSAVSLVAKLQRSFKINVSDIFHLRTIEKIAQFSPYSKNYLHQKLEFVKENYVNSKNEPLSLSLKHRKYLKKAKHLSFSSEKKSLEHILLTGATGHLGCNILEKLLSETSYKIYLLIRANSEQEAYERLNSKFKHYFNKSLEFYTDRFVVVVGDLEKEYLGLNDNYYQTLIDNIDSIIHSAALVRHYGEYDKFYSANVKAVINLLEFSKKTKNKDFHYISTIASLVDGRIPNCSHYVFSEEDEADMITDRSVYSATKYEAEVIAKTYRQYGMTVNIYRTGNIAMHSKTFRHQENIEDNASFSIIKTFLKFGIIANEVSKLEISPVDYIALAIVSIFDKKDGENQTYHLFNSHLCDLNKLLKIYDVNLKTLNINDFIDTLSQKLYNSTDSQQVELFMLHKLWLHEISANNLTNIQVLKNKTDAILSHLGFYWPKISKEMLSYMIECASPNK